MTGQALSKTEVRQWIADKAASASEGAKGAWNTISGQVDAYYKAGKKLVLDKDGNLNITDLQSWAKTQGDTISGTISSAYETLKTNGAPIVTETGNWLSKNWPMLAAIAAPLLAFNLDLGPIVTALLGVAAVGAAAYFSDKDSILGQGYDFIQKKTGLLPAKEHTKEKDGASAEAAPSAKTEQHKVVLYKDGKAEVDFNDIAIGGGKKNVILIGKQNAEGKAAFTSFKVIDDSGKPGEEIKLSAPIVADIQKAEIVDGEVKKPNQVTISGATITATIQNDYAKHIASKPGATRTADASGHEADTAEPGTGIPGGPPKARGK